MADSKIPEEFEVGEPVLVCRWRLSGGKLPAANRHMRALGNRVVNGGPLSRQLLAWAKQHIEWTLADGAHDEPDGTLMLMVDAEGRAAMAVGPYEPLQDTSADALIERAKAAEREADASEVAPETLWIVSNDGLSVNVGVGDPLSGSASLIADLASTLGISVERNATLLDDVRAELEQTEQATQPAQSTLTDMFLVSDEHGVVPAQGACGSYAKRFSEGWQTLLERTAR